MIVYSAIVPHLPIVPEKNEGSASEVFDALHTISQHLYAAMPDTIILLCQSSIAQNKILVGNQDTYTTTFESLGDFETMEEFGGDLELATSIISNVPHARLATTQSDPLLQEELSFVIHTLYHSKRLQPQIIPLSIPALSIKEFVRIGSALEDVLQETTKRVAIITVGNGSASSTPDSLFGMKKTSVAFENDLQSFFSKPSFDYFETLIANDVSTHQNILYPLILQYTCLHNLIKEYNVIAKNISYGISTYVVETKLRT